MSDVWLPRIVGRNSRRRSVGGDAVLRPRTAGFRLSLSAAQFNFTSQGVPSHGLHGCETGTRQRSNRCPLHGKNFCAAHLAADDRRVGKAGYRVIAPDQIGFCKSTKPEHYQYTFQQLACNTQALLKSLGVDEAHHHRPLHRRNDRRALCADVSERRRSLLLVSPIGLEDWKAKGVPWQSIDAWYAQERKTTADSVREYERKTYYVGQWKPEFDKWVQMYAGMFAGPGKDRVAWNSALLYDMIYTQPVFYELGNLTVPVLLIIGDKDNTAIGKNFAPPAIRETLGHYPQLAQAAAAPHFRSEADRISRSRPCAANPGSRGVSPGTSQGAPMIDLRQASIIVDKALSHGRSLGADLTVAVLDTHGCLVLLQTRGLFEPAAPRDRAGENLGRVGHGNGQPRHCATGSGGSCLRIRGQCAGRRPYHSGSRRRAEASNEGRVPRRSGGHHGRYFGTDEACAVAGIEAAGFVADTGAEPG